MRKFLKIRLTLTMLLFIAGSFCFAQAPPVFNVVNYGATGNGTTLDSPAINAAIAAAGAAGGGTVTFPPGNYFCGSIHLTNNLTLYLSNNAVILASKTAIDPAEVNVYSNYQDYGHSYFQDALIWGENLQNVTLAGPGEINGDGNMTTGTPATGQGDKALCLVLCSNVTITGITITNGGHFGILAQACTNMLVNGARIWEATSRDGFNLIDCSYVVVTNCDIEGSDDSMCLKSTYALGRKIGGHDIHITDCQILSTQNNATQFGSETVGDFSDVTFSNLALTQAGKAGIGITSQDGSVIDGMTYDNITMSNCACPIFLKLDYRTTDTPNPSVGAIRNISINNVVAVHSVSINTGIAPRTNSATIDGFSGTTNIPVENVTFNNVNLSTIGNMPATAITNYPAQNTGDWIPDDMGLRPSYGWYLRYASNISFTNCQVHFDHNDDRPAVITDTVTNVLFNNFTADVVTNNTNYDMGFLRTPDFEATTTIASATAPSPGAALRVFNSNSTPALIVSPPYFNPGDGIYLTTQSVVIASGTPGASIHYTTDGSTPTSTSGTVYSGAAAVNSETMLKACASAAGMVDSAVNTAIYSFTSVAGAVFSPAGGTYAASQSVTISSATPGASIRYTTDGSTPTSTSGTLYSGSVTISSSTTLNAIAYTNGILDSGVSTATYNVTGAAAAPTFIPPGGTYANGQYMTILSATSDASIRYTTNGSAPSPTAGTLYTMPLIIDSNAVVQAIAYASGAADSAISSASYTISPPPPPPPMTNFFFEAESIPYITNGAAAIEQFDANSSGGAWMALEAVSTNGHPYIQYTLANVPAGTYQLNLKYKGNTERGIITHQVDSVPLGDMLDQYSSGQTYPETNLCVVTFVSNGNHSIRQTVIGKNPANTSEPWASADRFGLLLLQPPQPVLNGALTFSNGALQLSGSGFPTLPYRVQANTNLSSTNWMTIGNVTAATNGVLIFTDTNASSQPAQFYRIVTP